MINLDINGQYVNYLDYGNKKKDAIVLLHGWGQNIEMMQMLGEPFKNEYRIIIVDFPGFGLSPEPKRVMDVNDYTILIEELLKKEIVNITSLNKHDGIKKIINMNIYIKQSTI